MRLWRASPPPWTAATRATLANPRPLPGVPRAASTRWVAVNLRSNALAHVTATTHKAHRLDFSDGSRSVPLRATAFAERLLASRSGNSRLARATDGTVWIHPHPVQVQAEQQTKLQTVLDQMNSRGIAVAPELQKMLAEVLGQAAGQPGQAPAALPAGQPEQAQSAAAAPPQAAGFGLAEAA